MKLHRFRGFCSFDGATRLLWAPALGACLLASGCLSDTALLQENAAVAMRSVRLRARQDLACSAVEVETLADGEVSGAPWGYMYSDYRIAAEGCGSRAVYTAKCRDSSLCDVKRETR